MNNFFITEEEANAIDLLMPGNQLFGLGRRIKNALELGVTVGKKFFLDPVNGDDIQGDGLSYATAVKTLPVAYALLTSNRNEILYIIGGASALNLAAAFTWDKSYTHLIGLCAGGPYGRSRIGQSANFTTMFTLKANGCIFRNIHFQMGRGSATNVNCFWLDETANYNTLINCHFDAPLNAVEGGGSQAYRVFKFGGTPATPIGARSNQLIDCVFGDWTAQPVSAAGALLEFLGVNAGTHLKRYTFIINTTQVSMVPIICGTDIGGGNPPGYVIFDTCDFWGLSTGVNVLCTAPSTGKFVFSRCNSFGVANYAATSNNIILCNGTAINARYGGLGVVQA
jgi:hypothetical protein